MPVMTYLDAISLALREEMRRDPEVFLLGEDIGVYGGAFKVTKGFLDEFGPNRVIDTPLSESAIVGASIGAAVMGMRPVAEMQFMDFISVAWNQLIQNAAKIHYRWGAKVPMVVRGPSGGNVHGGPYHSQNPESFFAHVPGLKVICPSTPYDCKGLLKTAIRDDNPCLFFEHKYLYRRIKEDVPEDDYTIPLGKADIKRPGTDITVIAWGSTVHNALEAAALLEPEGISVEVVDIRTLLPLDRDTILESVKRTGKVLVTHEDTLTGGFGGEIAALIAEHAFRYLDAPVRRLAALDTPVPFAPTLEEYFLPNTEKTAAVLRELAAY